MRSSSLNELKRAVSRFAIVGLVGGLSAACSSDTMRFAENPLSDPFGPGQPSEPGRTGSIDRNAGPAFTPMPRSTVSSTPLAAPGAAPPRLASAQPSPASAPSNVAGLNPAFKSGSMTPIAPQPRSTEPRSTAIPPRAKIASAPPPAPQPAGQVVTRYRLVEGKKPVVDQGRTAPQGKPTPSAARAEPIRAKAEEPVKIAHPRPGRVAAAAPAPAPALALALTLARSEKKAAEVKVAKAEPAKPTKVAQPAPAPQQAPVPQPAPVVAAAKPARVAEPAKVVEPVKVASAAPAKVVVPEPAKTAAPSSREPEATGALTPPPAGTTAEFRWPARGRVITGFGGGGSNEGINIAVPEGTPIKAAEAGTVAYAGSEVKGYGNLVLIRHDNGYVSAYAHNGEIEVKRGQKVTRGQLIAKSGQSGNVTSPQLHFEIRKGSTPVDPMPHLASN